MSDESLGKSRNEGSGEAGERGPQGEEARLVGTDGLQGAAPNHPIRLEYASTLAPRPVLVQPPPIDCHGVRASIFGLAVMDGSYVISVVARDSIGRISLRHGLQAQHPKVQRASGIILVSGGLALMTLFGGAEIAGLTNFERLAVVVVLFVNVLLGMRLISVSRRSGFFLDIDGRRGRLKIPFGAHAKLDAIQSFLKAAQSGFGYEVQQSGPQTEGEWLVRSDLPIV